MSNKFESLSTLYNDTLEEIRTPEKWRLFLRTASYNYKLTFDEQILLYAQKPDATAILPVHGKGGWNERFGRWVNRGAKGIALIDTARKGWINYYFDVSDTHESNHAKPVPKWEVTPESNAVLQLELEKQMDTGVKTSLEECLVGTADKAVENEYTQYWSELQLFDDEIDLKDIEEESFLSLARDSVGYILLTRCGIDADTVFTSAAFRDIDKYTSSRTIKALGIAINEIAKPTLNMIAKTVLRVQNNNLNIQTTETPERRSTENEYRVHETRGLLSSEPIAYERTTSTDREIRENERAISEGTQEDPILRPSDGGKSESALTGDRADSDDTNRPSHESNDEGAESDGRTEGSGSNEVGRDDEQHTTLSGRDHFERTDIPLNSEEVGNGQYYQIGATGLQILNHDFKINTGYDYYHHDDEKNELLRTCDELKDHREEIAKYFESHDNSKDRGEYLKKYFDNTYVEKILSNGQRAGYRAWDDVLTMWRGSYLTREKEVFLKWRMVADHIYGMMLLGTWLDTRTPHIPSANEQILLIEEIAEDEKTKFSIPQAAIDYVLNSGSSFEDGKFRIYEHFKKNCTQEENINFLKAEYGIGGHSDAIPGSGIWESHDRKGILLAKNIGTKEKEEFLISWKSAEKRIRELVDADLYLSPAQKRAYPAYQERMTITQYRREIASEYKEIVKEYADYVRANGEEEKKLNLYVTSDCSTALITGDKKIFSQKVNGEYILPLMRAAMQIIIDDQTPLTERCESILLKLQSEYVKDLEPTEEDLNPPKVEMEYRIKEGDTIYLDGRSFEIVWNDGKTVQLRDTEFPIFTREYTHEECIEELKHDILNNNLLFPVASKNQHPKPIPEIDSSEHNEDPIVDTKTQAHYHTKTVEIIPAKENNLPYEIEIQTIAKHEPEIISEEKPEPVPVFEAQKHNFRIVDDNLGSGTAIQRYSANITAIRLLQELEFEQRLATPEEQDILSRYVGWGGLPDYFDEHNSKYLELKGLLSDDEYAAARESTLTAFYTPPVIIRSVYQALENMQFRNGNILEPSCGIGNFIGMLPDSMQESNVYGVELDPISGRIAQQLYQNSTIAVQGFEKTEFPDSFFDVAVGNVPFGQFKVLDRRYDKHNFLIHDYFFARTLDKVRPGGIIAFITSKGTLDKENPSVRKYIAQRADLLGAIRLPNNTFKNAAGTEVTSDIIFLQKRDRLIDHEPDWIGLGRDSNGLKINQYFVDNPHMVIGEMKEISGPFGPETACILDTSKSLEDLLSKAIENIHAEYSAAEVFEDMVSEEDQSIPADPNVRNFSYAIVNGDLYYRENSRMSPVEVSSTVEGRIRGLIAIRDSVRKLIEYQTEDYSEAAITSEQKRLDALYENFQSVHGRINSRANNIAFRADSSYFLLSSLEVLDEEGNFVRKADMFTKRTIKQHISVESVDTASEALALSLGERTYVDMPYMMNLTGKTEQEICEDLQGVIFLNPLYGYGNSDQSKYLPADEYLSGNIREKLEWAERSAKLNPEDYAVNVEALKAVLPADLPASEISVRLGATWVPTDVVEEFMFKMFSTPRYVQVHMHVRYSDFTGEWNIEGKSLDRSNVEANNTYGTDRVSGYNILEDTLNLRDVRVFDYIQDQKGRRTAVLNKRETAIAQGKQEQIKQAFIDWIWEDPERRNRLCQMYNEKFNSVRPREYDGSHLNFVGINPEITLRPHQVNAIAHILYGGNTLLAHVVGAGKSFEMAAAAMESKRLGLCQKSMFVVPNHLTEQWASEFLRLYPSANILVATKKDFETKNRKRFCGRIATGDYDAVIIGHSQFEKIPLSVDRQKRMLDKQLEEILNGITAMKEQNGDHFSIKQMERTKKSVEQKLEKLNDSFRKDDLVTFEELGVDRLFIDEAHYYKNLAVFTKMRNVGGISQTEAIKSSDLYMKCQYLDELTGGRGVVFATGTPISNSMVEMYTMQKYLQSDVLRKNNLQHFDAWASNFGETVTAIELSPEGTGYRSKTRFSRFYNLPELMAMFKEVADIQTADTLKLPVPKANYHNVVLKPSEHQKEMVASLSERAEKVRNKMVDTSTDNMLLITNDGRKLALDQRMIDEQLPGSETSKINACAENVVRIWNNTSENRSTQMIFCDLSTPHNDGRFNVYDALREKLINRGIPSEEIAYIHNAHSEAQKKDLFGKVISGQVRVLLGSTQKMGAGTNVQDRLIALHHLDCPWRPSDLQQREGRIIRQGNTNAEVDIFTYVTENTFDSYLYQLVESKQRFIGQIMTSKSPVRSAEDIDESALSYAEIKALCAGNPHIKEKMDLDIAVQRLTLLKKSHLNQRYALEDKISRDYPRDIAALRQRIEGYAVDINHLKEHTRPNEDGFSPITIKGICYSEKKDAGTAILDAIKTKLKPGAELIGSYRGFNLYLSYNVINREYNMTLKNNLQHTTALGSDSLGNITRIDNVLEKMDRALSECQERLENTLLQLEKAKIEVQRPFPQEDELREKTQRLDELNILLNIDAVEETQEEQSNTEVYEEDFGIEMV